MSTEIESKECAEARRLAGLCFTDSEIALVLEIDADELATDVVEMKTPLAKAIAGGRLLLKANVVNSVVKLAVRGSSPAQKELLDMLKKLGLI